jgi:hypothetical protein
VRVPILQALKIGWMLVFVSIIAVLATWTSVYANGRVVTFDKRIAGPYEIAVGTIPGTPTVGTLHLTMTVSDLDTSTFVMGADVEVTAVGPDSNSIEIGPIEATPDPTDPAYYDVAAQVDRIGTWMFTVDVSSEQGDASATFPIEVREANPITGIITLIALLAFVAVLGFSVRAFLRERGKGKRQRRKA